MFWCQSPPRTESKFTIEGTVNLSHPCGVLVLMVKRWEYSAGDCQATIFMQSISGGLVVRLLRDSCLVDWVYYPEAVKS